MKVIFVNGSSHRDGTTMQLVKEMQDVFAAEHIDTEVIQLGNKAMEDFVFNVGIALSTIAVCSMMTRSIVLWKRQRMPMALYLLHLCTMHIQVEEFCHF